MFNRLCALGVLNFLVYVSCVLSLSTPSSGPEGIGSALLALTSLLFCVILISFGLKQVYTEVLQNSLTKRTVIATLIAALPLFGWLISTVLHLKAKR
jgi:hypothetical protein